MRSGINSAISLPTFMVLYIYTIILMPAAFLFSWFDLKKPFYSLIRFWAASVFFLMGKKFPVYGLENIEKEKKYILVANHASMFDILAIVSFYPQLSWFGHERLLKVPMFGRILRMTDYIPFRTPTVRNTRAMMEQLVKKSVKNSVAIFPEGTRTLNGEINNFYKGFIYLFRSAEMDILPITLNGFYKLKPKNRFSIDFGSKLNVVVHKPIKREVIINKTDLEIIGMVKQVIESAYVKNPEHTRSRRKSARYPSHQKLRTKKNHQYDRN